MRYVKSNKSIDILPVGFVQKNGAHLFYQVDIAVRDVLKFIKNTLPVNIRIKLRSYERRLTIRLRRLIRVFNLSRSQQKKASNNVIVLSETGVHYSCGYYDVSPFFPNQKSLLMLRTKNSYKPLKERSLSEVGYVVFLDSFNWKFIPLAETDTWCWQQGCRLQWLPGAEGKLAIFNKSVLSKPGAAIIDIESGKIQREIDSPIYAAHPNGQEAITLDFVRLGRMRPGYGYLAFAEDDKDCPAPTNNGLWKLSLTTGKRELLISLAELSLLKPAETMRGSTHYINHVSFNPSGSRLLFIHLWANNSSRFGRLITMNPDGSEVTILNNEGHASHYTWRNDSEILHYATHADEGTAYYLYKDITGHRQVIGKDILTEDGHPTFLRDKECFITDTYPDNCGDQKLLRYDLKENSVAELVRIYHPPEYFGEVRCDLHPRLDYDYSQFAIDIIKNKHRAVYIGQLS